MDVDVAPHQRALAFSNSKPCATTILLKACLAHVRGTFFSFWGSSPLKHFRRALFGSGRTCESHHHHHIMRTITPHIGINSFATALNNKCWINKNKLLINCAPNSSEAPDSEITRLTKFLSASSFLWKRSKRKRYQWAEEIMSECCNKRDGRMIRRGMQKGKSDVRKSGG